MTAQRELITEDHNFRHRATRRVPREWIQAVAERKGVPPWIEPEIHEPPNDVGMPGEDLLPRLWREYHWHWQTQTDPTGGARQVWFIDGPRAGDSTMVPVDRDVWQVPHCPGGFDGPLERYTYAIEQHKNGMWIGRCGS